MNIRRLFFLVVLSLPVVPTLLDSFGNPNSFGSRVGIDSFVFAFISILAAAGIFYLRETAPKKVHASYVSDTNALSWVFGITAVFSCAAAVILSVGEYALGNANVVYSVVRLNPHRILTIGFISVFIVVVLNLRLLWQSHREKVLFGSGVFFFGIFCIVSLFPFNFLVELSREDRLVEWLQFFVLLVSSLFALKHAVKLVLRQEKKYALIFFVLFLCLVFVCGDEISWGQRLLGFSTPETIVVQNTQQELTWHNLEIVGQLPTYAYIVFSFYGAAGWIFFSSPKYKRTLIHWTKLFVPQRCLLSYFIVPLLFNVRILFGGHQIGAWAEPSELFLYTGVFLWLMTLEMPSRQ